MHIMNIKVNYNKASSHMFFIYNEYYQPNLLVAAAADCDSLSFLPHKIKIHEAAWPRFELGDFHDYSSET